MKFIRPISTVLIALSLIFAVLAVPAGSVGDVHAQEEGPVITPQPESLLDEGFPSGESPEEDSSGFSENSVLTNEVISAGYWHTCGIKRDGTIACWGSDTYNQSSPPSGTFKQVSAGYNHTCGLKSDKSIKCWGKNDYGQSTPPAVTFLQVSAGENFTCGVRTTGAIKCWGLDNYGQSTPPYGTFTQVSAGDGHTCGLQADGSIICWGWDNQGQSTPPSGIFIQVSAGGSHSCGLEDNGSVVCWGSDYEGQSTPPSGTFSQISAGGRHTCGVKSNGTLACWGNNYYNQSIPPSGTFVQVSSGDDHTCGIKTDGYAVCRGQNYFGQSYPPHTLFGPPQPPAIPTTYRPSGDTYTTKPTYSWSRVYKATYYRLVVYDLSASKYVLNTTISNSNCSTTTNRCSYTPTASLSNYKNYQWKILASNLYGSSPYSAYRAFRTMPLPPPVTPQTYRPNGDTYSTHPTYSWSRVSIATAYRLVIYDIDTSVQVLSMTISSSNCSTITNRCSYTPTTQLSSYRNYQWKILASNSNGSSPYSAYRVFKTKPGFYSQFNGASPGWDKHPGGNWFTSNTYYYTNGIANKYSSTSYNKVFSNFTYQARIMQNGTNPASFAGLIVRGLPTFKTDNSWNDGLLFVYNKEGKFKIDNINEGFILNLKDWTFSSTILKNSWNTLKVTADGSRYKFYINGTFVWSGSNYDFVSGRVGLLSYSQSTAEKFYADWATLTMSDYYNKSTEVNQVMEEFASLEPSTPEEETKP